MSNKHNIPPFFRRRIDHHKFEKMMRQGIMYIYHDSKSLEEFKWKLVQATLENYLHYKYEIDLDTVPEDEVTDFIKYMIDVYDSLLKSYYYNARREGKGSINESNLVETFNKIVNKSINTIKNICETSDNETWPDWLNFDTCDVLDTLGNVNVKNVETIKKHFGKYPMFNVYIDVNFSSVFEWIDYDDFFISTVASDIIRTHNIHLIFHIDEQNNTHNRQMEGSLKPLIKNVLREEMTELQMYMWKIKRDLEDNYYKVTKKFEDPWLRDTKIDSVYWDNFGKVFEVVIKSDTNWELTWWVQFDQNMKMESVIRHETKDWEYNIKNVEEIGGFENDSKYFWSVIEYIYPYAQKYIIQNRKGQLKENKEINPLKKYFTKVWDTKKSEGKIPMFNLKQIRKLGLIKREDEIRNYYIEYIGGQEELVRNIKNYFIGKTFTTQDVEDMSIGVGNYDFVFEIVDMSFEQTNINAIGDPELYASFDIIEGTVDTFNGEHYDLTDHESINDELWWELDGEIKEMIENFIWHTVDSLGVNVDQVYLEWG